MNDEIKVTEIEDLDDVGILIIGVQKNKLIFKYGCQTIAVSLNQADIMVRETNAAISLARAYEPDLVDLVKELSMLAGLKSLGGDITTARALEYLQKNKSKLENISETSEKISTLLSSKGSKIKAQIEKEEKTSRPRLRKLASDCKVINKFLEYYNPKVRIASQWKYIDYDKTTEAALIVSIRRTIKGPKTAANLKHINNNRPKTQNRMRVDKAIDNLLNAVEESKKKKKAKSKFYEVGRISL